MLNTENNDMTLSQKAIRSVRNGQMAFCKFLSANDTGLTGGHQCGIYIPKCARHLIFDQDGERGSNMKRLAKIRWQGDYVTESKFIYYGTGTRNEYRITRFGRDFDLLKPKNTGALVVLVRNSEEDYDGWVLEYEDDINDFLNTFGMSPTDTGDLIHMDGKFMPEDLDVLALQKMDIFIQGLKGGFPCAKEMSATARQIYNDIYDHIENIIQKPDKELLAWNHMEYDLFRRIEEVQYGSQIRAGFSTMQDFIDTANSILNRRKSRAGKSLEFHLSAIFDGNNLVYESQVVTEEKKRPDFVFPSGAAYHDPKYPADRLIVLGAKTTCKDRWRQVITEADRTDIKYLCTLQQGISPQQLHEMSTEKVVLVVPKPYIKCYPKEYQESIMTLGTFIQFVREKTGACYKPNNNLGMVAE